MNLREVVSISTTTLFGVAVSAIAIYFFFFSPTNTTTTRNRFSSVHKKIGPQCTFNSSKREGYLSWDDYFMAIAVLSVEHSKDPNSQVQFKECCRATQGRQVLTNIEERDIHKSPFCELLLAITKRKLDKHFKVHLVSKFLNDRDRSWTKAL